MGVIGINCKIDVTKLDKNRFFYAESGAIYADLTLFLDTKKLINMVTQEVYNNRQPKKNAKTWMDYRPL